MAKDVKRRFTVNLEISMEDAEKKVKQTVGHMKKMFAEMGNASDKIGHLKTVIDYLEQIDVLFTQLREQDPGAFTKAFGAIDKDLVHVLENIFGTSMKEARAIDELAAKIRAIDTTSGTAELKRLAQEINNLFASIGQAPRLDIDGLFSGRADTRKTMERKLTLNQALKEFMGLWGEAKAKNAGDMMFGGSVPGSSADKLTEQLSNVTSLREELLQTISVLKQYEEACESANAAQIFHDNATDGAFSVDGIKAAINAYRQARKAFKDFSGDKQSAEYQKLYANYVRQAVELDKIFMVVDQYDDIAKQLRGTMDSKGKKSIYDHLVSSSGSAQEVLLKGNLLSHFTKTAGRIEQQESAIREQIKRIEGAATAGTGESHAPSADEIERASDAQNELNQKVAEFFKLAAEYGSWDYVSPQVAESSIQRLRDMRAELENLGASSEEMDKINSALGDAEAHLNAMDHEAHAGRYQESFEGDFAAAQADNDRLTGENVNLSAENAELREQLARAQQGHTDRTDNNDDDEIGDLERENGALEQKLELLQEIAAEHGSSITQKNINYQATLQAKYDAGEDLTSTQQERFEELTELIESAEESAATLGKTYEKIILTLENGKKIEILPEVKDLKKLQDFYDEGYGTAYKGVDIKDITFVRRNAEETLVTEQAITAEIQQRGEQAQKNVEQQQTDGHPATEGGHQGSADVSNEVAQMEALLGVVREVETAINDKTAAFQNESSTVNAVVSEEINNLIKLKEYLETIRSLIHEIFTGKAFTVYGLDTATETVGKSGVTSSLASTIESGVATIGNKIDNLQGVQGIIEGIKDAVDKIASNVDGQQESSNDEQQESRTHTILASIQSTLESIQGILHSLTGVDTGIQAPMAGSSQVVAESIANASQDDLDLVRENGLLEQKLELLREIAAEHGSTITKTQRNQRDRLAQKQMESESGLSDKEASNLHTLQEQITKADASLQQLGQTYEKIIIKLSDGTKMNISPNEEGLRKLHRFANGSYGGNGNGQDIEDIVFVRKNAEATLVAQQKNTEEMQQQGRQAQENETQQQADEQYIKDGHQDSTSIANENDQLKALLSTIHEVETAINNKTDAFNAESTTVDTVVTEEISALNRLKEYLESIRTLIQEIFTGQVFTVDGFETAGGSGKQSAVQSGLQEIKAILESIQGILHGFTGIEAKTKNSVAKKEPVVDTVTSGGELSDKDIAVLTNILDAVQRIETALHGDESKRVEKTEEPENTMLTELSSLIQSVIAQKYATEATLAAIKTAVDELHSRIVQEASGAKPDAQTDTGDTGNLYALDSTLQSVHGTLKSILDAINGDGSISELVAPLMAAVTELKNVANGIVQQQKAAKSDTSVAQARIANKDSYAQIKSVALGTLGDTAIESEVTGMKALANGVVQVTGRLKDAEGAWATFTVQVNEANEASKLAIKTNAQAARQAEEQADNAVKYTPAQTAEQALAHMRDLNAKGKKATLQYKDSGRYTVTTEEMRGGLSQKTFTTFDENQSAMSRTTVTLSNEIATAIRDANALITENASKVGNAGLLQQYNAEYANLIAMNQKYEAMDNLSDDDIATWNQQIALVQRLSNEVSGLIRQQQKLDGQQGVATSKQRLQEYQSQAQKVFDNTGIGLIGGKKKGKKSDIIAAYDQLIQKINDLRQSHAVLTDDQQAELDAMIANLEKLTDGYNRAQQKAQERRTVKNRKAELTEEMDTYRTSLPDYVRMTAAPVQQLRDLIQELNGVKDIKSLEALEARFRAIQQEIDELTSKADAARSKVDTIFDDTVARDTSIAQLVANADGTLLGSGDYKQALDRYDEALRRVQEAKKQVDKPGDLIAEHRVADVKELEEAVEQYYACADALQKYLNIAESVTRQKASRTIAGLSNSLTKDFKTLDFGADDVGLTDEQNAIASRYQVLIDTLAQYKTEAAKGVQVDTSVIEQEISVLRELIQTYKTKNNIGNARGTTRGKTYGTTQLQTATARKNSLLSDAEGVDLTEDATVVQQFIAAYAKLEAAQKAFKAGEDLTTAAGREKVIAFKEAQIECGKYERALKNVVTSSQKLASEGVESDSLGDDFSDDLEGRKAALEQYVAAHHDGVVAVEGFKDNCNKMIFTVKNADGTFTTMTASINAARTAIVSTAGETKKATSGFMSFISTVGNKMAGLWSYVIARFGIDEIVQAVKTGINYVRDIDGALTELKKVTDETDLSYDRFLQNMSKTASVVGSTVSELTTMAAEWARLGYSMEESAQLAESTAILLNVSEFSDATTASEALISTMQAFGYAADESQHVVDILNEVGNNYAVSSDGIATALQDSASSLMEAGNSLEQSVALIAAANKVVNLCHVIIVI